MREDETECLLTYYLPFLVLLIHIRHLNPPTFLILVVVVVVVVVVVIVRW